MAPTVLGIGLPGSSSLVSDEMREQVTKAIAAMDEDMKASPYDWEMFYYTPDMDPSVLSKKLEEKPWDIVMIGMGLRTGPRVGPFFEAIVNTVHEKLPKTKFAFNMSIDSTQEACRRVWPL